VRGREDLRDIDIGLIFFKGANAGEKLSLAQNFKEKIARLFPDFNFDVQAIDIKDFLDNGFLARQGIIAEGYLILRGKYFAELFGFKTFALIEYSLQGLSYSQKKMLYYALQGRRTSKGVLDAVDGKLISRGVLKIPVKSFHKIESLLKLHKVRFTAEFVMSYQKR